jgi:hypothetical protein
MAKKVYTLGLSSIEVGAMAADGGMGTSLAALGYTNQDSCNMTQEDPTTSDFYAEEVDDPVVSISRAGKTTFNFSLMNPSVVVLAEILGGTSDTTEGSEKWNAPDVLPTVEKSVRITPQQGLMFEVPRMKLTAKINGAFSKSGIFLIDIVGTVMQPTKTGLAKMTATAL